MGLKISSNITSQAIQKNLKESVNDTADHLEKLSSGKRITKASDDAAGLAIATNLKAQTDGLRQATRNANDGVSLVQTAEGGLQEVSNLLIRLRELSIQAASDTVGNNERGYLDQEYQQLSSEIDRISGSTIYNGESLLNGTGSGKMDIQVGAFNDASNVIEFDSQESDVTTSTMGLSGSDIAEKDQALSSVGGIDEALNQVSGYRAKLGAIQSRLHSTISSLEIQTLNQDAARSFIEDVDIADSSAKLASANITKAAGIATLAQANNLPNGALKLVG